MAVAFVSCKEEKSSKSKRKSNKDKKERIKDDDEDDVNPVVESVVDPVIDNDKDNPKNASFVLLADNSDYSVSYGGIYTVDAYGGYTYDVYLLKMENKTSKNINMSTGHYEEEPSKLTYGIIDGKELVLSFADLDDEYSKPFFYITSPKLGPGETRYYYVVVYYSGDLEAGELDAGTLSHHATLYFDPVDEDFNFLPQCALEIN